MRETTPLTSSSEAAPFLRYDSDLKNMPDAGDSDSASCGGDSDCGSGAGSCAHVPEEPSTPVTK